MDGQWHDSRSLIHHNRLWALNDVTANTHNMEPILNLTPGQSVVLNLKNNTVWPHTMHLHGHTFRVLSRNGAPTRYREWQDSVLVEKMETVQIAFVADNPGDWMFHYHMLAHHMTGMISLIHVAA